MHTIRESREIDAPAETVWNVLDDYGNLQAYSPKNTTCELLDGPETGVGARRETAVDDEFTVVHEIVAYEPGEQYTFEFTDVGEYPVTDLLLTFEVEALDDDRTLVTMTADFSPKWGPLGWVLAKTIMKRKFREPIQQTLDGLEQHVRTGERVTPAAV